MKQVKLPFTVVIPIPYRDKAGKPLTAKRRNLWESRVTRLLGDSFGGATPIDSQGEYRMADGTVSLELGQRAVVAVCTREAFLSAKAAIELAAEEMMTDLDQEAVCVLPFPGGESFLIC